MSAAVGRRLAGTALLALLLAGACSCADAAQRLPSTGAVETAPTVAAPVPVTTPPAGRGCRLPLSGRTTGGAQGAGFLQLATGTAAADAAGGLLPGSGGDPRARTVAAPVLRGAAGTPPAYDRAAGRWVPAPPPAISPDGLHYAYAAAGAIHVVEVRSGDDRVLHAGGDLEVLGFVPQGIYAVHRRRTGDPTDGLWLLDPSSGALSQVRSAQAGVEWAVAGPAAVWASAVVPGAGADEVWRLDPSDGAVATWFHRQGVGLRLVGVDGGGHPLVQVAAPQASSVWLVSAPGQARQVSESAPGGDDTPGYPASVTDAGGTWISDDGGNLYRFTPTTGLRRIDVPRLFPTAQRVAGGCS